MADLRGKTGKNGQKQTISPAFIDSGTPCVGGLHLVCLICLSGVCGMRARTCAGVFLLRGCTVTDLAACIGLAYDNVARSVAWLRRSGFANVDGQGRNYVNGDGVEWMRGEVARVLGPAWESVVVIGDVPGHRGDVLGVISRVLGDLLDV